MKVLSILQCFKLLPSFESTRIAQGSSLSRLQCLSTALAQVTLQSVNIALVYDNWAAECVLHSGLSSFEIYMGTPEQKMSSKQRGSRSLKDARTSTNRSFPINSKATTISSRARLWVDFIDELNCSFGFCNVIIWVILHSMWDTFEVRQRTSERRGRYRVFWGLKSEKDSATGKNGFSHLRYATVIGFKRNKLVIPGARP